MHSRLHNKIHSLRRRVISSYRRWSEPDVPHGSLAVAINKRPVFEAWGGGNQFLNQLVVALQERGVEVRYSLKEGVQLILIIAGRENSFPEFFIPEIKDFKRKHNLVRCIHRINDLDLPRGTSYIDEAFRRINEYADTTVFISEWVKNYYAEKWFDTNKRSKVIYNGADPAVYYPGSQTIPTDNQPWRIVTHHWSDNPTKGWYMYRDIDRMIASGKLRNFELTVIGNWPKDIKWQSARALPPMYGMELADELRKHHIYLTAANWEACGMHQVEGVQCGLPLVYHEDGGGIVELGKQYGVGFLDDVVSALNDVTYRYKVLRSKILDQLPLSGKLMCEEYIKVLFPDLY